ncbi:MAG: hypothetical protein ACJ8G4_18965 [Burkholderiales bacterium]
MAVQTARKRAARLRAQTRTLREAARGLLVEARDKLAQARNIAQVSVNRRALRKLESRKK